MTAETIDITPHYDMERITNYAEENMTRDPQTHLTASLEVLSDISTYIDDCLDAPGRDEEKLATIVNEIGRRHRAASRELMSWFK